MHSPRAITLSSFAMALTLAFLVWTHQLGTSEVLALKQTTKPSNWSSIFTAEQIRDKLPFLFSKSSSKTLNNSNFTKLVNASLEQVAKRAEVIYLSPSAHHTPIVYQFGPIGFLGGPPHPHRHGYHRPYHRGGTVQVIDEVTPFYNFVRRHILNPAHLASLVQMGKYQKEVVIHHVPPPHKQRKKQKNYRKKHKPSKFDDQHRSPKQMLFHNDPYDAFYYDPKKNKSPKSQLPKMPSPEEYNAAVLEAFSPAWAESIRQPIVARPNRNPPKRPAKMSDSRPNWLEAEPLVMSPAASANSPYFYHSVDDYENPLYQPRLSPSRSKTPNSIGMNVHNATTVVYVLNVGPNAPELTTPMPKHKNFENILQAPNRNIFKEHNLLRLPMTPTVPSLTITPSIRLRELPSRTQFTLVRRRTTIRPIKFDTNRNINQHWWDSAKMTSIVDDQDLDAISSGPVEVRVKPSQNLTAWSRQGKASFVTSSTPKPTIMTTTAASTSYPFPTRGKSRTHKETQYFQVGASMSVQPDLSKTITAPKPFFPRRGIVIDTKLPLATSTNSAPSTRMYSPLINSSKIITPSTFHFKSKNAMAQTHQMAEPKHVESISRLTTRSLLLKNGAAKQTSLKPTTRRPLTPSTMGGLIRMGHSNSVSRTLSTETRLKDSPELMDKVFQVMATKSIEPKNKTKITEEGEKESKQSGHLVRTHVRPKNELLNEEGEKRPPTTNRKLKFNSICANKADGYHPDLNTACKTYVWCKNGAKVQSFNCATGTKFSQISQICDWPHNVQCGESN